MATSCLSYAAGRAGINPATIFLGVAFAIPKAKKTLFEKYYNECKACTNMLDSQLSGLPYSYRQNAKKSCYTANYPKSGCDYIERFNAGGDEYSIQKFQIDCDKSYGNGSAAIAQQQATLVNDKATADSQLKMAMGIFAIIVVMAFVFIYFNKHPKNGTSAGS